MALDTVFELGTHQSQEEKGREHAVYSDGKLEIRVDLIWRNIDIHLHLEDARVQVFSDQYDGMLTKCYRLGNWVGHLVGLAARAREAGMARRRSEYQGAEQQRRGRYEAIDEASLFPSLDT